MPISNTARLARLLSHATGGSYQASLQIVEADAVPGGRPIIAEPVPSQEQLEGAVFGKMAELRWQPLDSSPGFGIKRVTPAPDHLIIELDSGSDIAGFILNVMPIHQDSPGEAHTEMSGIPGLRARDHELGVSLFRLGHDGEVIIKGVSAEQWESAQISSFSFPHDEVICAATVSPGKWTKAELDFDAWRRRRFGDEARQREAEDRGLQSAVLRRIGLINRLSPRDVSTWGDGQRGVVIEIFRPETDPSGVAAFIKELTSPRLSPQLSLKGQEGGTVRFSTPRNGRVLEVRIVR